MLSVSHVEEDSAAPPEKLRWRACLVSGLCWRA